MPFFLNACNIDNIVYLLSLASLLLSSIAVVAKINRRYGTPSSHTIQII